MDVLLYFVFCSFIYLHVLGKIMVYKANSTWRSANTQCITNGGILARSGQINCQNHNVTSFWLGGYQTSIWIKPLGCFNTSSSPTVRTIQACLKNCKTKYIGHLNSRCFCLNSIPTNKTSQNRCNIKDQLGEVTMAYEYLELHSNILKDNGSSNCLKLRCNNTNSTLSPEPCSTRLKAICEKSTINGSVIEGTQDEVEKTCNKDYFSVLKDDDICSKVDRDGQRYWTGIRRYRTDQFANRTEVDDKAIIGNCIIGICLNNAVKINVSKGNCDDHLIAYACNIEDKLTSTTATEKSLNSKVTQAFLNTESRTIMQTNMHSITSTMENMFTHEKTSITTVSSTTAKVVPPMKNEVIESTSKGNLSSSSYTVNRPTEMDGHGSPSRFDNSDNDIIGIVIGVAITILIAAVALAVVVLYFRRRSQQNTESSSFKEKDLRNHDAISNNLNSQSNKQLSSENYESPWDSNDNKINSLVLEHVVTSLHNDSTNKVVDKTDCDLKTDLNTCAVVYKPKTEITRQNEDIYNRDDVHEGDYDRINLVFTPTDKDLSSDNIYDTTFGARESDDYTYSSTNHGILKDSRKDLYS